MRFKVPQNIDMPDRIVGPLTMIQFVEAVLGGGLAYVCYTALPAPINLALAMIAALFTLAVVFVKINERPFLFYLSAFLKFMVVPKQRVWQKDAPDNFEVEIYKAGPKVQNSNVVRKMDREKMMELAKNLDSQQIDKIKLER